MEFGKRCVGPLVRFDCLIQRALGYAEIVRENVQEPPFAGVVQIQVGAPKPRGACIRRYHAAFCLQALANPLADLLHVFLGQIGLDAQSIVIGGVAGNASPGVTQITQS